MFKALEEVETLVEDGSYPAVAIFGTQKNIIISHDYWLPARQVVTEEVMAAEAMKYGSQYGVFVVPLVIKDTPTGMLFVPPPYLERDDGATEELFALTFDVLDGYDITRELFTRRPNGDPVWDSPRTLHSHTRINPNTPGFHLFQAILANTPEGASL